MIKTYTKDTLTREVLDQGVKLRVIDADHSRAFQEALFKLGVGWYSGGGTVQYTNLPFLYARGYLWRWGGEDEFRSVDFQEIYFDDERDLHTSGNYQEGVSLRDYFAGKVLQGTLAFPANEGMTPEHLAEWSYTVADAMLKFRGGVGK